MSSFTWGMIACIIPRDSQMTGRGLRHLLFSPNSSNVLLTVLHSDAHLGSAYTPLHFGLSLCNLLQHIRLPYIRWKGIYIAFIWGIIGCPPPRGCIDMKAVYDLVNRPSLNFVVIFQIVRVPPQLTLTTMFYKLALLLRWDDFMSEISKVDRSLLFRFAGRKDRRASVGSVIRLIWSVH